MLNWHLFCKQFFFYIYNYISTRLLYISAQISLSVTSVNNVIKSALVVAGVSVQDDPPPPMAWPGSLTPSTLHPTSLPPHPVVGYLPEHRSDGSQPWGAVRVVDGAGGDQGRLPLTQQHLKQYLPLTALHNSSCRVSSSPP